MKYIIIRLPSKRVSAKGSYWDDAFAKASPAAALEVVKAIHNLESETNLKANFDKFHIHAPNDKLAKECEELFKVYPDVKIHSSMNLTFLRTPVGADDFVEAELDKKLKELRKKVKSIAAMPFKMEAFSLLRACLSRCRVTHLIRTLPSKQISKFLREWDKVLRQAFETLINSRLDDKWWAIVRLNSKYGGMGLKSGMNTAGAQHLASLVNAADGVKRFIPAWNVKQIVREATEIGSESNCVSLWI